MHWRNFSNRRYRDDRGIGRKYEGPLSRSRLSTADDDDDDSDEQGKCF